MGLLFHPHPSADEPGGQIIGYLSIPHAETIASKNSSHNPGLITSKLKKKKIIVVGWKWQILDSSIPTLQWVVNPNWALHTIHRISCCISYEPVVQEGAPHHLMQIPNFFLPCCNSALDSVLCSLHMTAVFLSVTTVGQLMLLWGSLNSIICVGKNVIPD